ncbi:toll-like receptor 3 [Tachyglossus aculeatus]|uniref:toll-like receptor 3 n=1 Tax=Tachyglossus aculeatus TaxID=9261 RepID=UPI0018F3C21C|nr:toll-like receptor 3 [Tachyglossus aculeatus]
MAGPSPCQLLPSVLLIPLWTAGVFPASPCRIAGDVADCSHLKLTQIPPDLPPDIRVLNLTHNQLKRLPAANFSRYARLGVLDGGFNDISKVDPELCASLSLLRTLNLQHNELTQLSALWFARCAGLAHLYLMANSIQEVKGDPFLALTNLSILDLSHNHLSSAKLGTRPQLGNLQQLLLSNNKINILKEDDLEFLANSSLRKLELSSNQLQVFSRGCLRAIGQLTGLWLNNMPLGPKLTELLCAELSGTHLQSLALSNTELRHTTNTTFQGLGATNLTTLDLSLNSLTLIAPNSFIWLPHLETLTLASNSLVRLQALSFSGLSGLRRLSLRAAFGRSDWQGTPGPVVEDGAFAELRRLEVLSLEQNNLGEVTSGTFLGLVSLKHLSLSGCHQGLQTLTNRTFASLAASPLLLLNLSRAKVEAVEAGAFSQLGQLRVLDLGVNEIRQRLSGYEWVGLAQLEELYLSYNPQVGLNSKSFAFVPSLRRLLLRRVGCGSLTLAPSPFRPLRNLMVLDLSNNNIPGASAELLEGLDRLEVLDLQHNNLARLWKAANPGGPVLFLRGLSSLRTLQLESNGLDEVPVEAFRGLVALRTLDLGLNNLNLLPAGLFADLAGLHYLNLQKNLLTTVPSEVFGPVFRNLSTLDLSFNPFDCTCASIAWFVAWLNSTRATIPELHTQYRCNTPPQAHGSLVVHFDDAPCKDSAPFEMFFVVSASALFLFTSGVLLAHFQGWRLKFYCHVVGERVLGRWGAGCPPGQPDFAAYVIHAQQDSHWVWENFASLEEQDPALRFCLEERDLEAGRPELEAIVSGMRRSRKIIFLVTHHLLEDPLCRRFKVHHAVHQAIEQNLDSIVLVFLQDIPDYRLNHALGLRRGMFRSHCVLRWPPHQERLCAFHQKLRAALGAPNTTP